jgi:type IX secretion system PorP/SprF family membrane protein
MKKLLILLAVLLSGIQLQAQQDHQYTQFMYNKLLINPAYAGARNIPFLTGIYRNQWVGFDGAPKSALISFNSPFLTPRVGIGATISSNKIGLQNDFYASLAYSYDLIARDGISLRAGINGSLRSLGVDFTKATPLTQLDPSLNTKRINDLYGNVGAGIYATVADHFYAGFSVPSIYTNVIGHNPDPNVTSAREARHFYGMAGGIIPLSEDLSLMPAVLVKYVKNAPVNVDLNLNLDIRRKITAGISYRTGGDGPGDSVDLLLYWQATEQIGVGAAYDFSLSRLKDYNSGSFELLAMVDLKKATTNKKKKMTNPRFFM